mgnify:CR=1 FL=1
MCHNKNELRSAVAKYRRLQAQKVEIEEQLEQAKQEILDYLDYNNIEPKEKVKGQNFVVSFSLVPRYTFDKNLLIDVLGEDLTPYQNITEYKRLYVK